MLPPRATLPITPEPGLDRLQVVVEHDGVGPGSDGGATALHRRVVLADRDEAVEPALGRADGIGEDEIREPGQEAILDRGGEHRGASS